MSIKIINIYKIANDITIFEIIRFVSLHNEASVITTEDQSETLIGCHYQYRVEIHFGINKNIYLQLINVSI